MSELDPRDRLLDQLQHSAATLKSIATRHGMTLRDLARWADAPQNAGALASLRALADTRAALVVSRSRIVAAKNLLRIASGMGNGENLDARIGLTIDNHVRETPKQVSPSAPRKDRPTIRRGADLLHRVIHFFHERIGCCGATLGVPGSS